MKLHRTLAIWLIASAASQALTEAEITATALLGKTLTFQAANGSGLLPTSGSWTGTFEPTPNRDFTITNQGGTVSNHASHFTAITSSKPTVFSLTSIYQNSGTATLSLSLSGTQGSYTLSSSYNGGSTPVTATQGGTFTVSTPVVKVPEIQIKEGTTHLVDGTAKSVFGTVKVGKASAAKTFKITNKGKAALKNLKITASGINKADFVITKPGATSLAAGKSTTFSVTFKPSAKDVRKASIKIASNDADENPFNIRLSGVGAK